MNAADVGLIWKSNRGFVVFGWGQGSRRGNFVKILRNMK